MSWISFNANAEYHFSSLPVPSCPFPICFLLVVGTGVLVPLWYALHPGVRGFF